MDNRFRVIDKKVVSMFNDKFFNLLRSISKLSEINLYDTKNNFISINARNCALFKEIVIPIGLFSNTEFKYCPVDIEISKNKISNEANFNFSLRDNQTKVVKSIRKKVREIKRKGVPVYINLSLGCAFGKTVIGTYLITKYKLKTLIIVPRKSIISQWEDHLNHCNITCKSSLQGATKLLESSISGIDVLIVPDKHLSKTTFVSEICKYFSMVIIDESHFYNMQNDISITRFLATNPFKMCFGLTGSPRIENRIYLGCDITFNETSNSTKLDNDILNYNIIEKTINIEILNNQKLKYSKVKVSKDKDKLNIHFSDNTETLVVLIEMKNNFYIVDYKKNEDSIYIKHIQVELDSPNEIVGLDIFSEKSKTEKIVNIVSDKWFDCSYLFSNTYIDNNITKEIYTAYRDLLKIEKKIEKKREKTLYYIRKTLMHRLISYDVRRHESILRHIKKIYIDGVRCLILTEFRENMDNIFNDLCSEYKTNIFKGDVKDNILETYGKVKSLDNEKYILVSTISASFQGINIENLNTLILVTPVSDEKVIIQAAGRILRENNSITREIFIYNDCSISEDVKNYLVKKNENFLRLIENSNWVINRYLF